jgi:hypothetical protein
MRVGSRVLSGCHRGSNPHQPQMKKLFFISISLFGFSCCTIKEAQYETETVKIPVVSKYQTTRQHSVFPPERVWIAKLANGDSIKSYNMPPDTVTFIYYKKVSN